MMMALALLPAGMIQEGFEYIKTLTAIGAEVPFIHLLNRLIPTFKVLTD
jgi:hypothetical protein